MGGVTPEGKVYTLVRPQALNGLHTIAFLVHLGHLAGDRLLVVWDGSPIHRRAEVSAFIAEARGKIHVEPLPSYAPDLNPVEWLLVAPQGGRVGKCVVPGPRSVAPGTSSGPRSIETEAEPCTIVLRGG